MFDFEWAIVDELLPSGVIEIKDDDGAWWRYPIIEFTTG